nr:2'-5' RNA ligase family protein [Streptomyces sp. SID3343]
MPWLHLTVMEVGSASEVGAERVGAMVERAREALKGWSAVTVNLGRVLYHPEAIVLAVEPDGGLDGLREGVQGATAEVLGKDFAQEGDLWSPHVTLAYSTAVQPAAPVIATLGRRLPGCEVTIRAVTLIDQRGPERDWDWHPLATVNAVR